MKDDKNAIYTDRHIFNPYKYDLGGQIRLKLNLDWCGWGVYNENIHCIEPPMYMHSNYFKESLKHLYFNWQAYGDFPHEEYGTINETDGKDNNLYAFRNTRCFNIAGQFQIFPFRGIYFRCLSEDCEQQMIYGF